MTTAKDLEVLVTLLEVAAACLSPRMHAEFTEAELIHEAQSLSPEMAVSERDLRIVIRSAPKIWNGFGGRLVRRKTPIRQGPIALAWSRP